MPMLSRSCVAKWVNGGGENEWYFFQGAGLGFGPGVLPQPCSLLPSGLSLVQYYPDKQECYPAADLSGSTAAFSGGGNGQSPSSVTILFAGICGHTAFCRHCVFQE